MTNTIMSLMRYSISKYDDWYFHIYLSGGELGYNSQTKVKYKCIFPDNSKVTGEFEGELRSGYVGWCTFFYSNPSGGATGTVQCFFYDSDGNEIGQSERIRVTD